MATTKEKKETLSGENYTNVLGMLNSPDKENTVVGLNCIEAVDFKESLMYIMLLKKFSSASSEDWKTNAPKVTAELTKLGLDVDKPVTLKKILQTGLENKVPEVDINFYLKTFADYLTTTIKGLGYDYVEEIEIQLKSKEDVKG